MRWIEVSEPSRDSGEPSGLGTVSEPHEHPPVTSFNPVEVISELLATVEGDVFSEQQVAGEGDVSSQQPVLTGGGEVVS